jgi:two-component system, response regulator
METAEPTILLVEDNEDDIDLTLRALNKSHLANDVVVARDGREALNYLRSLEHREDAMPVLVLLDLRLPVIDGLDVLRAIRADERTRNLPVLIMTASRDDADRLQSHLYGASGFMVKPGDYDQLMMAVKKLGLYWSVAKPPRSAPHPELSERLGLLCRYAYAAA